MSRGEFQRLQRIQRLVSSEGFLLLIVTALAAALRLYALDRLPAGLYHDEAYNGLDALGIIRGLRPIFFEANNGREPLFIYLVAGSVSLLGRSPLAIRLVAALLGILTVPATYGMTRELLGRREALLAALVTAGTFWHLNLSRLGLRCISLPLLIALCLWLYARGMRRRHWRDFALAGLCLGLSQYTYTAARFLPIVFAVLTAYRLGRRQPVNWRGVSVLFAVALLVSAPLLMYAANHLSSFGERSSQVSIFNPAINQGSLGGTLVRHLAGTLAMFNWRGDFIPRHNMPYRPVFDPVMGVFFLLGLGTSMYRAPRRQEYALLVTCWLIMLLPTILAEGAPHFLRAVGVMPVLFVFPAVGLVTAWEVLRTRTSLQVASLATALVLGLSLYTTVNDYFFRHVSSEAVYYNFETGAAELAGEINRFLGAGWQPGSSLRVPGTPTQTQRQVYLDDRLWRDWASIRYLVPESPSLTLFGGSTMPPPAADQVWLVAWPYAEHSQYLALLPRGSLISARDGPMERGDLEKEPRRLCTVYEAMPAGLVPSNLGVQFERGVTLLGYELSYEPGRTQVRLFWRAASTVDVDYSVFVHLRKGDQKVAQSDSFPAQGHYPTHLWRPGDVVVDDHMLAATVTPGEGHSLFVGLYQLQTMIRLQVLDPSGAAVADAVTIPVP